MQGNNRPRGIRILAAFTILAAIMAIPKFFNADSSIILFGALLKGTAFRIFNTFSIIVNLILAVGIFKLRRWSYYGFLCYNVFFLIVFFFNILLANSNILLSAGWKDYDDLILKFRLVSAYSILIGSVFIYWIYRYRRFFLNIGHGNLLTNRST